MIFVHGMPSFYGAHWRERRASSIVPSADPPGHQTLGRHGKGLELYERQRNGKILDNVKSAIAKDGVYCPRTAVLALPPRNTCFYSTGGSELGLITSLSASVPLGASVPAGKLCSAMPAAENGASNRTFRTLVQLLTRTRRPSRRKPTS